MTYRVTAPRRAPRRARTAPARLFHPPRPRPVRRPAARLSSIDTTALHVLAGLALAAVLIEVYALLTGAPHLTVMFGGQG